MTARVPIPRKRLWDVLERHEAMPVLVLLREKIAREGDAALAGSGVVIPQPPPASSVIGAPAERAITLLVISLVDQLKREDTTEIEVTDDIAWPRFEGGLYALAANQPLTGVTMACAAAVLALADPPDPVPGDEPPTPVVAGPIRSILQEGQ